jgi:hypothetical protein
MENEKMYTATLGSYDVEKMEDGDLIIKDLTDLRTTRLTHSEAVALYNFLSDLV